MRPTIPHPSRTPWIWRRRYLFTACVTIAASLLYLLLFAIGSVPETLQYQPSPETSSATTKQQAAANVADLDTVPTRPKQALPTRVVVPAVGIDTNVRNPTSEQPAVLNDYLSRGAVRYPASGYPGNGNLFVFGHSTSHETVWNQAYKTFNRLEDVSAGDEIIVHTESGSFTYRVTNVTVRKNSRAYVPLNTNEDMITISTCDSFGAKEDRIVVRGRFTKYTPAAN